MNDTKRYNVIVNFVDFFITKGKITEEEVFNLTYSVMNGGRFVSIFVSLHQEK